MPPSGLERKWSPREELPGIPREVLHSKIETAGAPGGSKEPERIVIRVGDRLVDQAGTRDEGEDSLTGSLGRRATRRRGRRLYAGGRPAAAQSGAAAWGGHSS